MNGLWIVGGLALAWLVFRIALRPVLALLFGREIGKRALAKVPETVHLTRGGDGSWKGLDPSRGMWEPLLAHGFADAGTYVVDQMPGVVMRLLASPTDAIMAIAYEHPQAGRWLELVTYYTDGRRCSASNRAATGVDSPSFVTVLRAPGAPPLKLLDLMRHRRPEGTMIPLTAAEVAGRFEQGYAESLAWRKQHPITTREVVKVSLTRGRAA